MSALRSTAPKHLLGIALFFAILGGIPAVVMAETAMVVTDGVNLQAKAGRGPAIATLNQNDYVRLIGKYNQWANVETPEGQMGWLETRFLQDAPDKVKPLPLSKEWQASLETFLSRFRQAVKSGQFQSLATLLSPKGVIIERRSFPDAVKSPSSQTKTVVPQWYASDVSLTYGSAWELLMQGTTPPIPRPILMRQSMNIGWGRRLPAKKGFPSKKKAPCCRLISRP